MSDEKFHNPEMAVQEMIESQELKRGAYSIWLRHYKKEGISLKMKPFFELKNIEEKLKQTEPSYRLNNDFRENFSGSWLKDIRQALFLSAVSVSARLGLKTNGISVIEKSEINGSISLNQLKLAAEAYDCELVYAIVPKNQKTPDEKIWDLLYPLACKTKFVPNANKSQRMHGIASSARMLMEDFKFRKEQGWCTRNQVTEVGVFREISRLQANKLLD